MHTAIVATFLNIIYHMLMITVVVYIIEWFWSFDCLFSLQSIFILFLRDIASNIAHLAIKSPYNKQREKITKYSMSSHPHIYVSILEYCRFH